MTRRLEDKVIVVTGGTKGIGKGIALSAGKEGAKVIIGGRDQEAGKRVVQKIIRSNTEAIFIKGDLMIVSDCQALIDGAIDRFGQIDGLVNNAAIDPRGSMLETDEEMFDKVFAVDIKGAFFCSKFALKYMKKQGGGSIVNIGSTHGFGGSFNLAVYSCAKGALHTLTQHIARNYAYDKIRANWITVGWVATEGEFALGETMESLNKKAKELIPMGELQTNEDIASGVIYLLADESKQVTGTDIHITGGFIVPQGPN